MLQPFCNDPFDEKNVSDFEKLLLNDCVSNKCVKQVDIIKSKSLFLLIKVHYVTLPTNDYLFFWSKTDLNGGNPTITRLCAKSEEHAKELCDNKSGKPEFSCKICETDGCNGAIQYGPIALLVAIPVAVARISAL